jgi:hypothetical protein
MSDASEHRSRGRSSLRNGLVGLVCCAVMIPLGWSLNCLTLLGLVFFFLLGVGFSLAAVRGCVGRLRDCLRSPAPLAGGALALAGVATGMAALAVGGLAAWQVVEGVQDAGDRAH